MVSEILHDGQQYPLIPSPRYPRRIYPLDERDLTPEQLAVVFAMTSRRPEAFDEIARQVSETKASEFHEKWVLGYGHASVAEHAVLHFAVENISRLACDALEDNRLASYTEKSSRFQVMPSDAFFIPPELDTHPALRRAYVEACQALFGAYERMLPACVDYLKSVRPPKPQEKETAYALRLRREAIDACRFVLPAATLTNVGVTMNARTLEHAITKLLSSDLQEERDIGQTLKEQGRRITPTLVKYAEASKYLQGLRQVGAEWPAGVGTVETSSTVRLVWADPNGEERILAAFLYPALGQSYHQVAETVRRLSAEERQALFARVLGTLGDFDSPPRALEMASVTLEVVLDYGAYREFKRHRMQTYIAQPLRADLGYVVPELLWQAGLEGVYHQALHTAERVWREVVQWNPRVAEYLVTHAHRRRVLAHMNLREAWHILRLRTGPQAHFSLREVMEQALALLHQQYPSIFRWFRRRTR
ncbi:MAG: FAD-dependent thymidylate synthase [Dehalococcoidia bacterium]|nr:FAD-dependent thymidylate synthase [Dehalococcoidia bacterium]MDW8119122.1 FAD-dependent thymidylate synthase [Chloroflexota bacterium]